MFGEPQLGFTLFLGFCCVILCCIALLLLLHPSNFNRGLIWKLEMHLMYRTYILTPLGTQRAVCARLRRRRSDRRLDVRMMEKVKHAAIKCLRVFLPPPKNDVEMNYWQRARQSLPALHYYSFSKSYGQGQRKWVNSPFNTRYIRGN